MYPTKHLVLGFLFSLFVFAIFPRIGVLGIATITFSSFLIDADHYMFYACKKKDLSPFKAYNWFLEFIKRRKSLSVEERKKYKHHILIFHGVEFWTIVFIISLYYNIFTYVLAGVMFHIFLDIVSLVYSKMGFSCILSQIYNLFYNRNRKDLLD